MCEGSDDLAMGVSACGGWTRAVLSTWFARHGSSRTKARGGSILSESNRHETADMSDSQMEEQKR